MEIRELKSFHAVGRLKSVSKAAKQLHLGQPTVTMHIKKLEEELGVLCLKVSGPHFERKG